MFIKPNDLKIYFMFRCPIELYTFQTYCKTFKKNLFSFSGNKIPIGSAKIISSKNLTIIDDITLNPVYYILNKIDPNQSSAKSGLS